MLLRYAGKGGSSAMDEFSTSRWRFSQLLRLYGVEPPLRHGGFISPWKSNTQRPALYSSAVLFSLRVPAVVGGWVWMLEDKFYPSIGLPVIVG